MLALKSGPQITAKVGNPAGLLCRRIWYSVGNSGVLGITEYRQGRPLLCRCRSLIQGPGTVVGSVAVLLQVQNCSLLLGIIWDKSSDIKIGQWGRPWLVWYVPCKRRCVPRFTKLKHRHRHHKWHNDRRWRQWRCVSPVKKLTRQSQSELSQCQWQSVGEPHDAIFTVSDELPYHSNHR